jgi:hypothetical protein
MNPEKESPENNPPADRTATRVVVMAVNPYLLHAYWQISQQDLGNIRHALHESPVDARPVLRFYDITCILFDGTNAHQIFDVEVDLRTMKWNVPVWSAGKSYVVDLGYKASDGRFYAIARSNIVNLPRAEPSQRLAEGYLRVEGGPSKGAAPVLVAHVPPEKPVEAARPETMHGMRKETGEPFEGKAERVKAAGSARAKNRPEQGDTMPRPVPKTAAGEQRPVHDLSGPFDLVHLTQEKFSFGVSSPGRGMGS